MQELLSRNMDDISRRRATAAVDEVSALIVAAGGPPIEPKVRSVFIDIVHRQIFESLNDIVGSLEQIAKEKEGA